MYVCTQFNSISKKAAIHMSDSMLFPRIRTTQIACLVYIILMRNAYLSGVANSLRDAIHYLINRKCVKIGCLRYDLYFA